VHAFSIDTNNNLRPEPRMCSLTLRPGTDTIGISLEPDQDFGHLIRYVDTNSLAARAGIESDDCIMKLNDTPLLNMPYDDVLATLKKSRNDSHLDFLVAKKSYLLQTHRTNSNLANNQHEPAGKYTDAMPIAAGQVMPSSNINTNTDSSSLPATVALEQLYNKYSGEQKPSVDERNASQRPKETVSTTTINEYHNRVSSQPEHVRYSSKQQPQQQQGQIMQGVGPATADRTSWNVGDDKTPETLPASVSGDVSTRLNGRDQRPGSFSNTCRYTHIHINICIYIYINVISIDW
jgi:hypothetical protein